MPFTKYFMESKVTTIVGIVSLFVILANLFYPKYFPIMQSEIFGLLVQLDSTILGFALLGLFFFMGKFDDKQKEVVNLWFEAINVRSDFLDEQNKLTDLVLELVRKSGISKTPVFSTFVNRLTEFKSNSIGNIDNLRSMSYELTQSFKDVDSLVDKSTKFVVTYFGFGIGFSLIGLFLMWNDLYQISWTVFILSVSFTIDAIDHYYYSWRNMRNFGNLVDNLRIMLEQTNYIYKNDRQKDGSHHL